MDIAAERAYPTPMANSPLLPMLILSLMRQKVSPNTAKVINSEYDYVIVGAGSSGSVVASRLSEIPCVSVLLLEAGKSPPYISDVPGVARYLWGSDLDWNYRTAPQRHTGRLLTNRQIAWPSGKTLGGSSTLNGFVFARGNRQDYDDWAAAGAEGWSYKDVFPYFLKMEDNWDPEYVENGYHGVGGLQTIHRPRYEPELRRPVFKTVKEMGYKVVDPNGPTQTGFYDNQDTLRDSQRCSTAKAYLVPAENRTNLDIFPNARVRKVVIRNRQAVGVEFDFQGETYIVKARREVILSAGAINSAQLLMLSGIGPREELERHKIPIVADLPVGKNLQDHCASNVNFELRPDIQSMPEKLSNPLNIKEYIQNRTGPLASAEFVYAIAFLKDDIINPREDLPNYEVYFAEMDPIIGNQIGLTPEAFDQVYAPYVGKPVHICYTGMLRPRSRGTVTLESADPYAPPVIDPNYLEDPRDVDDIIAGLKTCNRVLNSPALRKLGSVPFRTLYPGCEKFASDEDEYFRCMLRGYVFTLSHQVGTATMGDPRDPRTVVDPQLRVKYIKGLRVIDCSVMPLIPRGNTNIPAIMVAEKASDMIKATIKCHQDSEHKGDLRKTDEFHSINQHQYPATDSESFESFDKHHTWPTDADNDHITNAENSAYNGNRWKDRTVLKVTPWNKELLSATPWNQGLLSSNQDLALDAIHLTNISRPGNSRSSIVSVTD